MAVIDSLIYGFLVLKIHKLPLYALYYVSETVGFFCFEAVLNFATKKGHFATFFDHRTLIAV